MVWSSGAAITKGDMEIIERPAVERPDPQIAERAAAVREARETQLRRMKAAGITGQQYAAGLRFLQAHEGEEVTLRLVLGNVVFLRPGKPDTTVTADGAFVVLPPINEQDERDDRPPGYAFREPKAGRK